MFHHYFIDYQHEKLSVRHYQGESRHIFLLHGAGNTHQAILQPVAKILQKHHHNVISFDYSGHGESSHNTYSSIQIKTQQALKVIDFFNYTDIHLFAWSMSGQIAVNLLEYLPNIRSLTLFAPALYAQDIMNIPFGKTFKMALQENENWYRSNAIQLLPTFKGKVTLIRPEYDPIIPYSVNELYKTLTNPQLFQEIILPNAPHHLGAWFYENPQRFNDVLSQIIDEFNQ